MAHDEYIKRELEKGPGDYVEKGENPDPDGRNMTRLASETVKEVARVQEGHTGQLREIREVQGQHTRTLTEHTGLLTELRETQHVQAMALSKQAEALATHTQLLTRHGDQ